MQRAAFTLLLLQLCTAHLPLPHQQQPYQRQKDRQHQPQRIPADISKWHYHDGPKDQPEDARSRRFWDRATLQRAAGVINYEQLRPFLAKLNRGEPVALVAFGDSIVATHGGCYHRDMEHLKQHIQVLSSSYLRGHCTSASFHYRWAASFLGLINATWPHRDHILINHGVPAASFKEFAAGVCLEYMLPGQVDLVLLEHLPYLEHGETATDAERLLHRLQLHLNSSMPPVIILNMQRALHAGMPAFNTNDACIRNISLCASQCPSSFKGLPEPGNLVNIHEMETHALARYYGMTSFSHGAMIASLLRDNWHVRLNLSECELFATLYKDSVHPSDTGRLLLSDLLTNYLVGAEEYFSTQAQDPSYRPALHSGLLQPLAPLHAPSLYVPRMRCYGSMEDGQLSADPPLQSSGQVVPIKAVRADGWAFQEMDNGVFKPGWIATAPGAVLQLEVDTDFGDQAVEQMEVIGFHRGVAAGSQFVGITFLESYEHMGMVRVSCVAGCSCKEGTVDAHQGQERHSIPRVYQVSASRSRRCVVQLQVLEASSSGQHKFKVMQVVASAWRDAAPEIGAIKRAQRQGQR